MPQDPPAQATVRAVDRALDILLCFARSDGGLSLSEIARSVHLHKSTVHRLLASLQAKGFVRKHPQSDRYFLGWSVLELISGIYQSDELSSLVLPEMTRLRDATGESVVLYVRSGYVRIRIQAVETSDPGHQTLDIGNAYPLYLGAAGKVLLAYGDPEVVESVLQSDSFPAYLSPTEFQAQLQDVRAAGFAISFRERDPDLSAMAAPVFGRNGFLAALAVTGKASRLTEPVMQAHRETLLKSARLLTRLLSH
ncbi:MAG: IclR family transcriptional regulator [Alicyclobacillus sp.]|nr:IclR family transcriptional regulator [Alicyclobacillus sp.]